MSRVTTSSRGSGRYGFSATRIADLGAAEYTLVAIAADASGSVSALRRRIERCMRGDRARLRH